MKWRKNTLLGVILHPYRRQRSTESIKRQTYCDRCVIREITNKAKVNGKEAINEAIINAVNRFLHWAKQLKLKYTCIWQDDVATPDDRLLEKMQRTLNRNSYNLVGFRNWGLDTGEYSKYVQRVWMFRTDRAKKITLQQIREAGKTISDADVAWQKLNNLKPYQINTDWSHWIPTHLTAAIFQWVIEHYDASGNHWIEKDTPYAEVNQTMKPTPETHPHKTGRQSAGWTWKYPTVGVTPANRVKPVKMHPFLERFKKK